MLGLGPAVMLRLGPTRPVEAWRSCWVLEWLDYARSGEPRRGGRGMAWSVLLMPGMLELGLAVAEWHRWLRFGGSWYGGLGKPRIALAGSDLLRRSRMAMDW